MEPELKPTDYDAALRAAREKVTDLVRGKPATGEYTLAMNALTALAKAVGAFERAQRQVMVLFEQGDVLCPPSLVKLRNDAMDEADRLAAPYLEVKA